MSEYESEFSQLPLPTAYFLLTKLLLFYRKFKGLRPLGLHVVSVELGFKSLTPTVFNFEF